MHTRVSEACLIRFGHLPETISAASHTVGQLDFVGTRFHYAIIAFLIFVSSHLK